MQININVFEFIGAPMLLRTDRGTENSVVAFVQPTLRSQNTDCFAGEYSFHYGRSTSNQVIYLCEYMCVLSSIPAY